MLKTEQQAAAVYFFPQLRTELCAQDGAMCPRRAAFLFFHPQDRTMERVATDLRPVFREQKYFGPGRKQGRREFFFGRGSVAPSTRSASQTAIEPIEPGLIPITPHITPCITLYTHIPRTPPPPTPVGGITLENHNLSTETSVNQQSNRYHSLLEKSLLYERNTYS